MEQKFKVSPIAPSSAFDQGKYDRGIALLAARGFDVSQNTSVRTFVPGYLNGSDETRLDELHRAMNDSESHFMWMARGGYGLLRLLPSIKLPKTKIPTLVGISDTTALHCHLWKFKRQKGIHGSNITRLTEEDSDALGTLWAIMEGRARDVNWPALTPLHWPEHLEAQGPLIVANLCVLTHLIGTSSMPDLAGCILVLEDIGERPYRIDRMLTQLWQSGSLKGVKAIALGQFSGCSEPNDATLSAESVVIERCRHFDIPLCAGLPIGHDIPNWALPFGAQASLEKQKDAVSLRVLEELF